MAAFGASLVMVGSDRGIERGEVRPGYGTIYIMAGLVILLALALIADMIFIASKL